MIFYKRREPPLVKKSRNSVTKIFIFGAVREEALTGELGGSKWSVVEC